MEKIISKGEKEEKAKGGASGLTQTGFGRQKQQRKQEWPKRQINKKGTKPQTVR